MTSSPPTASGRAVRRIPRPRLLAGSQECRLLHFHWPQGYWRATIAAVCQARSRTALPRALAARIAAARALGYRIAWTIHQSTRTRKRRHGSNGSAPRSRAGFTGPDRARRGAAASARAELGRAARDGPSCPTAYLGLYEPGAAGPRFARSWDRQRPVRVPAPRRNRATRTSRSSSVAFRSTGLPNASLVVAGTPADRGTEAALREAAAGDARIVLRFGFVPENGVAELYDAADAAVVARGDGGTSGSLILALSMGKAVVAADRPSYRAGRSP